MAAEERPLGLTAEEERELQARARDANPLFATNEEEFNRRFDEATRHMNEQQVEEFRVYLQQGRERMELQAQHEAVNKRITNLYPSDMNAELTGAPDMNELKTILGAQAKQLETLIGRLAEESADNPHAITAHSDAARYLNQVLRLQAQADEYVQFQKKVEDAAKSINVTVPGTEDRSMTADEYRLFRQQYIAKGGDKELLPPVMPEYPSRAQVLDIQDGIANRLPQQSDLDREDIFADIPRQGRKAPPRPQALMEDKGPGLKQPRARTVGELNERDSFTGAVMRSDDPAQIVSEIRVKIAALAEQAYEAAGGPKNDDYRDRFIAEFKRKQETDIERVKNHAGSAKEYLAQLEVALQNPESFVDNLRSKMHDRTSGLKPVDGKVDYMYSPEVAAQTASNELTADIQGTQVAVRSRARDNGQTEQQANDTAGRAVAAVAQGADPEAVKKRAEEKMPRAPDLGQDPVVAKLTRAAQQDALADVMFNNPHLGLITLAELVDRNGNPTELGKTLSYGASNDFAGAVMQHFSNYMDSEGRAVKKGGRNMDGIIAFAEKEAKQRVELATFTSFDEDKNGRLTQEEFIAGLKKTYNRDGKKEFSDDERQAALDALNNNPVFANIAKKISGIDMAGIGKALYNDGNGDPRNVANRGEQRPAGAGQQADRGQARTAV